MTILELTEIAKKRVLIWAAILYELLGIISTPAY